MSGIDSSQDVEELWESDPSLYSNNERRPLFEDGTNLPFGTSYRCQRQKEQRGKWFDPSETDEDPYWRQRLEQIRRRFEVLQLNAQKALVRLEQVHRPFFKGLEAKHPDYDHMFGNGLSVKPCFPLKPQTAVIPDWAFLGEDGAPILNPAGEPEAGRLGFSRRHFIKGRSSELTELCTEASKVLPILPSKISRRIWHNWKPGFHLRTSEFNRGIWVEAVFELAWQKRPNCKLKANRFVEVGSGEIKTRLVLFGRGLYPRCAREALHAIYHFHGYPQRFCSELPDLIEASIQAIYVILSLSEPENPAAGENRRGRRKKHTCSKGDEKRILEAWKGSNGEFMTKQELAVALNLDVDIVKAVIDRARK